MAVESVRGCGFRKVGGIYLVMEGGAWTGCDRLPYELCSCHVCGSGVHLSRAMTLIDPVKLFGQHEPCADKPDILCNPLDNVGVIMLVGAQFYKTPADFMLESVTQGVSRRIPFIPKGMVIGKTVVYLAHKDAVIKEPKVTMGEEKPINGNPNIVSVTKTTEPQTALGIFSAFVPRRVEKLIWQSEATPVTLADLEKRGITPVIIPDGDKDHAPSTRKKSTLPFADAADFPKDEE